VGEGWQLLGDGVYRGFSEPTIESEILPPLFFFPPGRTISQLPPPTKHSAMSSNGSSSSRTKQKRNRWSPGGKELSQEALKR